MESVKSKQALDVVALGDLILNFVHGGKNEEGFDIYERQPAGATANLLSQVVRLGGTAGLITTVGDDFHGDYLYQYAKTEGLDVTNVLKSDKVPTRMMFVHLTKDNDRYFPKFNCPRTDVETRLEDIDMDIVKGCKALAMSLFFYVKDKPIYKASQKLVEVVREQGGLIGFDCNWRGDETPQDVKKAICDAAMASDIVKVTDAELGHYFGESDLFKGTEKMLRENVKLVAVTLAENGCFLRSRKGYVFCPAYDVSVADTTGAGDSFMGSLLYQATREGFDIDNLNTDDLMKIAEFSSACSSYSTTHRGSMSTMGTLNDVKWIMENIPKRKSIYV